jgi:hypothetical protein
MKDKENLDNQTASPKTNNGFCQVKQFVRHLIPKIDRWAGKCLTFGITCADLSAPNVSKLNNLEEQNKMIILIYIYHFSISIIFLVILYQINKNIKFYKNEWQKERSENRRLLNYISKLKDSYERPWLYDDKEF